MNAERPILGDSLLSSLVFTDDRKSRADPAEVHASGVLGATLDPDASTQEASLPT